MADVEGMRRRLDEYRKAPYVPYEGERLATISSAPKTGNPKSFTPLQEKPFEPFYAVKFGRPGDGLMIGTGRARRVFRGQTYGVVYVGYDSQLIETFARQDGVVDVRFVKMETPEEYERYNKVLCNSPFSYEKRPLADIPKRAGLKPSRCINCCVDWAMMKTEDRPIWHGMKLSRSAWQFAVDVANRVGRDFLVVQPESLGGSGYSSSCPSTKHWAPREEALNLLLKSTDWPIVLFGWNKSKLPAKRVLDLTGWTDNLEQVLATVSMSAGYIGTPNSVGLYTAIDGTPAILCANEPFHDSVFHHFCEQSNITIVGYKQGLVEFWRAMSVRFAKGLC
jgi:hypothetical protein